MEHWNQEERFPPCPPHKELVESPDGGQEGPGEDGLPSKGGGHFWKVGVVTLGLRAERMEWERGMKLEWCPWAWQLGSLRGPL